MSFADEVRLQPTVAEGGLDSSRNSVFMTDDGLIQKVMPATDMPVWNASGLQVMEVPL